MGTEPDRGGVDAWVEREIASMDRADAEGRGPRGILSEIAADSLPDLAVWLRSQLDADERVAVAASTEDGSTPGGEHWRWECDQCDIPIPITPVTLLDEFLECPNCQRVGVGLRSAEEYPTQSVGLLPHLVVKQAEELRPVDGLHIATHDPAHVLRTVAAHRAILDLFVASKERDDWMREATGSAPLATATAAYRETVRRLAQIYEDRPGFDPSWRADG